MTKLGYRLIILPTDLKLPSFRSLIWNGINFCRGEKRKTVQVKRERAERAVQSQKIIYAEPWNSMRSG